MVNIVWTGTSRSVVLHINLCFFFQLSADVFGWLDLYYFLVKRLGGYFYFNKGIDLYCRVLAFTYFPLALFLLRTLMFMLSLL